jgi:hypothetical protein
MWTEKKCKLYNFGTDGVEEKYIGCSRYLVHGPWAVASGPRTYLANIKVRTAPLSLLRSARPRRVFKFSVLWRASDPLQSPFPTACCL